MRALGLFGGGLDSRLAGVVLRDQGLEVEYLHFETGLVSGERESTVRRAILDGEPLEVVDAVADHLGQVVAEAGEAAYDGRVAAESRIFMLRQAARIADERSIDLLFTGEVLGQTALDQSRGALARIALESGIAERLLRPLSARHLPETRPETEGRVDRGRLFALQGRSRREQLDLAQRFGLELPAPTSGNWCRLANPAFAHRVRDLLAHGGGAAGLPMLRVGRHFRLSWNLKVVVARDAAECRELEAISAERWVGQVAEGSGAVVLIDLGDPGDAPTAPDFEKVAGVALRYSSAERDAEAEVLFRRPGEERRFRVRPTDERSLTELRI